MSTAAQLRSRWKTPPGCEAASAAEAFLRGKASAADLTGMLAHLVANEEVVPALDLRGVKLPHLISVKRTDLSGARFDFAQMNWNFGGSILHSAVFNGAEGRNVDFGGCDLQSSSFRKAKLPGAMFYGAKLQGADLSGISMRGGQLRGADCRNATFVAADLRMVWAADADFRGADLRQVNLNGASLGGVRWDSTTRLEAAQLTFEGTPEDLQVHALTQGASLHSEKPEWELSLLDATLRALASEDQDPGTKRMTERLRSLRPQLERNPGFLWANALREEIDKEQWGIFQRSVRKAASNIGALLK